ncbi:MAG: hypothetical protein Fur0043_15470 [Anaerolineales bacterium]
MTHARLPRLVIRLLLLALLPGLACRAVTDFLQEPATASPVIPAPLQAPATQAEPLQEQAASCPAVTEAILSAATDFNEETGQESPEEPEEQYLVTYLVTGDDLASPYLEEVPKELTPYQEDETEHRAVWNLFTRLIPPAGRADLAEFAILTDGPDNLLAAVTQTASDPARWALEVDILDAADRRNLTYTLIHEYAHLLTLGPSQVIPSRLIFDNPEDEDIYFQEASACPQYFPGEGCSHPESYLNAFFHRFWADIHAEWQDVNLIEDDDAYYAALDEFYVAYADRFVTDYAATNPEEDIAEAFTFFVLSAPPAGDNIAEEKILFFYEYPELVQMRAHILTTICASPP